MRKKAVSPIISTVLLVLIVVIIAVIIMLWSQGFVKEVILKEVAGESKTIERFCGEVAMVPIYNEDTDWSFGFQNTGNIPIYKVDLEIISSATGSSRIIPINRSDGNNLVDQGISIILQDPDTGLDFDARDFDEIKIIPVLLGHLKSGAVKEFRCSKVNGMQVK